MPDRPSEDLPELFAELIALPEDDRAAAIERMAGGDGELRTQLHRMLAADAAVAEGRHPLGESAIEARAREAEAATGLLEAGAEFAGYEIVRALGRGGMGEVYLARQDRPRRDVALKVVRAGLASDRAARRFEFETETLGRLRHPGIAQVYAAGVHERRPYFAMEYIDGPTITEHAETNRLNARQRLRLVAQVASAVQHAHQQGIVHRDLKPDNILVANAGGSGGAQPKVLDFGIAKATDADVNRVTMETDIGQLVGTIPYMSPEQAGGDPTAIDARSDVYALGVLAFELLAGRLPHDLSDKLMLEAVRMIREDEPSRLSSFDRSLRGDVETIVAKALERDPARRYDSAASLGSDIERYLAEEPIAARPASTWYQLRKFSRRNRVLVGGVAASFVMLSGGVVGTTTFAVQANAARAAEAEALAVQTAALGEASAARDEAADALALERERSEQLVEVADFYNDQFLALDPVELGADLKSAVLLALPAEDAKAVAASLQTVNFVDVGARSLASSVFDPALEVIATRYADQPLVQASLLQSVGRALGRLGLWLEAIDPLERALEIAEGELGREAVFVMTVRQNLGRALWLLGENKRAEEKFREVLEQALQAQGPDGELTLLVQSNLASALLSQGKSDEAEALFAEVLARREAVLGDLDPDTISSINSMGGMRYQRGDYEAAAPLFRAAWLAYKPLIGEDDPRTLDALNNYTAALVLTGRVEEAEPLAVELLEASRRTLGDAHPDTVSAMNTLAGVYRGQGKREEALGLYDTIVAVMTGVVGPDHPNVIMTHCNVALLHLELERVDEAAAAVERATAGADAAFPPGHPLRGKVLEMESRVALERAEYPAASAAALEAHELLARGMGPEHPMTIGVVDLLVSVYEAWDEADPDAGHDASAAEWVELLPPE